MSNSQDTVKQEAHRASGSRVKNSSSSSVTATFSLKTGLTAPLSFSVWNCSWRRPPECYHQLLRWCLSCRAAQDHQHGYVSWPVIGRQARKVSWGTVRPSLLLLMSRDPLLYRKLAYVLGVSWQLQAPDSPSQERLLCVFILISRLSSKNFCLPFRGKLIPNLHPSGADFFGFSHPAIHNLIQSCPGARKCVK